MGKEQTALVIGAGFSGIDIAIKLSKRLGIEADIFDYSSEVGGTWHANTYPGCACDVASHLYSFSYELNPNWSQNFSPQSEIYAYLRMVAKKHDVYKNLQLNTTVLKLEWIPDINQWKVDYCHKDHPEQLQSKHYDLVFSATGGLRVPKFPTQLKGFAGTVLHTAQWDSSVDFTGKRVGLVGNGASAVQVLPYLQKSASHLYNFQRTPSWVGTRVKYKYSSFVKALFTWIPLAMVLYRWFLYWFYELRIFAFKYPRSSLVRRATKQFSASIAGRLKAAGRPDLAISLMPDFAIGCKRILGSEDYYETLAQENVTVIPHALDKIDGQTLYSDGQGYDVDILVLATGFDIQDHFGDLTVIGKDGVNLHDLWQKDSPRTFKTVMVSGFPNFFQFLGPGSALGHNSVLNMIESQSNFCVDSIKKMNHYNLDYIEPTVEAQEKFSTQLIEDLKTTVWVSGGCVSWYQHKNGSVTLWSGSVTSFWWELKRTSIQDFVQTHNQGKKLM